MYLGLRLSVAAVHKGKRDRILFRIISRAGLSVVPLLNRSFSHVGGVVSHHVLGHRTVVSFGDTVRVADVISTSALSGALLCASSTAVSHHRKRV